MKLIEWLVKQYFLWICFWLLCALAASNGVVDELNTGNFWEFAWYLFLEIAALYQVYDTWKSYKKSKGGLREP